MTICSSRWTSKVQKNRFSKTSNSSRNTNPLCTWSFTPSGGKTRTPRGRAFASWLAFTSTCSTYDRSRLISALISLGKSFSRIRKSSMEQDPQLTKYELSENPDEYKTIEGIKKHP